MKWGFFSTTHILTLVLAVGMIFALHYGLRRASEKVQTAVLGVLSFSGIAAVIYNLLMWRSPLEYLPLHLCSLNALVLPVAVFTKNKTLGNLLLVWCLGAVAALVMNNAMAEATIPSWPFFFFYFPHVMELAIPIVLVSLGRVKKDPKCIVSTVAITMACYTVIHFINLGINHYCAENQILNPSGNVVVVNYMYSIFPDNPLVALFQQVIPGTYWHMYLAVPIVVVYLLCVYAPELFRKKK